MATTTNLALTLLEASQAQKEVTINEALMCLDAMIGSAVTSRSISTPPGSPATGVVYIVGASPTGAWAGQANKLAYFDQVWRFITPLSGARAWVRDELRDYQYNGSAWQAVTLGGSIRVVTAAGAVTTSATDYTVVINKTTGAATTVNLTSPASTFTQVVIIKDGKGDAATNNLTITPTSGTIDGAASYVLSVNYASVECHFDGTNWWIIS